MDRQKEIFMLQALNEAIWLRDKVKTFDRQGLFDAIISLAEHGIFSSRQIAMLTDGAINHSTISKMTKKKNKTGGTLNPQSLNDLREIFHSRARNKTNYKLVAKVINEGTSQIMVERLTGVSQSSISRYVKESNDKSV